MAENSKKAHPPKASPRPRPGLGRGLGALIGAAVPNGEDAAASGGSDPVAAPAPAGPAAPAAAGPPPPRALPDAAPAGNVLHAPVGDIERSPWQPRHTFDEEALRELADSIRARGVIQPLICRRTPAGTLQLIAGERRLRAAIDAGLQQVPVLLVDAADRDAAEMTLIENVQREDLNVLEQAEGYRTLLERFGLTQQEVADRVGKPRASVANVLRLLDLPDEVRQLVGSDQLSAGHAKVLLGLTDEKEMVLLARRTVADSLTVRGLEKAIARRRAADKIRPAQPDIPENHVQDLADRLHRHFATRVRLVPGLTYANGKRAHGSLTIEFYGNDDLDRILKLLGIAVD
jgi:ParB family chromosome partitioning protein